MSGNYDPLQLSENILKHGLWHPEDQCCIYKSSSISFILDRNNKLSHSNIYFFKILSNIVIPLRTFIPINVFLEGLSLKISKNPCLLQFSLYTASP